MARGKCNFRQRDLTAAIKAARAAGVEIVRVEIVGNKIIVVAGNSQDGLPPSELDQELAEFEERRHGQD